MPSLTRWGHSPLRLVLKENVLLEVKKLRPVPLSLRAPWPCDTASQVAHAATLSTGFTAFPPFCFSLGILFHSFMKHSPRSLPWARLVMLAGLSGVAQSSRADTVTGP